MTGPMGASHSPAWLLPVVGTSLGHAAQCADVVEHLCQGHVRFHELHASRLVVKVVDHATATVQVSDDITHVILGGNDLNL